MQLRPKLLTIQMLRAVAASMVALGHATIEVPKLAHFAGPVHTFNYGFGVDIFFVISGFIMMYTAGRGFGSAAGRKSFVLARLARIVPIYWLLTTVLLVVTLIAPTVFNSPRPSLLSWAGSYLFLPVPNAAGEALPILALGWTLNYEMMFYALFAMTMFLPRRFGVPLLLAVLAALSVVGALVQPASVPIAFWTNAIVLEFGFGILLALGCAWLCRLPVAMGLALMLVGFAGFVAIPYIPSLNTLPRFIVDGIPAAIIVAGALICDLRYRSLAIAPLILLGDASYSLYLSHMFSVRGVRIGWNVLHWPPIAPAFCVTAVAMAVVLALVLANAFELPLHRAMRRRLAHAEPAPAITREVAREPS